MAKDVVSFGSSLHSGLYFLERFVRADWVKKMCSGRNGGRGNRGKVLVRDQSGVIAQVAATAAPRLVTAAVPRELRVDPCEKKSKREELGRVGQRSVDGRRRGSR